MEREPDQPVQSSVPEAQPDPAADARAIKVSVSMPGTLVADVRARVGKREFSRYVAEAVEQRLRFDRMGEIVQAYVEEFGPLDPEALKKAEELWDASFGQ